jgi:DNA helicase-2/ATP-dependent DNA helicase PcrA
VCRKGLVTAAERTLGRCRTCPSTVNVDLLDALREWRLLQAKERSVPAYVVFTDVTLTAIAEQEPTDADALLEIPGVGPKKLDAYGDDLLALVARHAG